MARAAVLGRLTPWRVAETTELVRETPRVQTVVLDVPDWPGHAAGQHVDVRLTAEDGYQAQRSYSIASPPGDPLALTVERLEDGEVSPYLVDELRVGDRFEVRGPIGGYFVWDADGSDRPVFLVAGGSGVVPLAAMARHRVREGAAAPMRLLYSSRSWEEVIYREELEQLAARDGLEVVHTLTRSRPPGWTGYARRIDADMLSRTAWPPEGKPIAFVCGPTVFVETVAAGLVALGYTPEEVKTERFGATGS
jgi:ferredoxin-NADP reductase